MRGLMTLATGIAVGAFAMYMFDPEGGRGRRAQVRENAASAGHDAERLARGASRHAVNPLRGAAVEARSRLHHAPVSDSQLHERIRSQLGRLVDQPGNLQVKVDHGHVTLSGSAKASEIEGLVTAVSRVQGVEGLENRLSSGTVPPSSPGGSPLH